MIDTAPAPTDASPPAGAATHPARAGRVRSRGLGIGAVIRTPEDIERARARLVEAERRLTAREAERARAVDALALDPGLDLDEEFARLARSRRTLRRDRRRLVARGAMLDDLARAASTSTPTSTPSPSSGPRRRRHHL